MAAPMKQPVLKKYLIHFAHEHIDFRIAELVSVLKLFKIETKLPEHNTASPFMTLELPSEDCVRKLASRLVLVRSIHELWGKGKSYDGLRKSLLELPKSFVESHTKCQDTFKFQVTSFNKVLTMQAKLAKMESLLDGVLNFEGKVDLRKPKHVYNIFEFYGDHGSTPTEEPVDIYFGKWIADGQRDKINEFHLRKRQFLANTSMDAALAMIMANIGRIDKNMFVFDPFVGSGSLLVSAAAQSAYVLGTDINYLLLHARAKPSRCTQKKRDKNESIRANLQQYGLEKFYIDALIADSSKSGMWRQQTVFDVIITDPPYGIREGTRKVGSDQPETELTISGPYIPPKTSYHISDIYVDLLNFSAQYLHKHGRLVYWFPVSQDRYKEENIPQHPCLRLIHNCEQKLNSYVSRRLITMEKVADYTDSCGGAVVSVDHFEEGTFREMYFNEFPQANKTKGSTKETDTNQPSRDNIPQT